MRFMFWPRLDKRGFTLLEIMMTVALLGTFFGIVYGFLNHNLRFLNYRGQEHSAYLQARTTMLRVTNLLNRYEQLEIDGNMVKGDGVDLIDFSGTGADTGNCRYYYYRAYGSETGQLRNISGGVVADGIKTFDFVEVEPEEVIRFTVDAVVPGNPHEPGLTLSTKLRIDRGYSP